MVDAMIQDLRYAVRTLRKTPAFTIVALITIGLGIGANTAVFSVVDGVLLRPLPFPEPERFTHVGWRWAEDRRPAAAVTALQFEYIRENSRSFEALATYRGFSAGLADAGATDEVRGLRVSEDFFRVVGFRPALGRAFAADEVEPGGPAVAILGHDLWRDRFGADPEIVGRTIRLESGSYTVVGVMAQTFRFPQQPDYTHLLVPLRLEADPRDHGANSLVIGRLKPNVTPAQVRTDLAAVGSAFRAEYPGHSGGLRPALRDFTSIYVGGGVQRALWILLGAVLVVLLIGCANVANLLLVRAAGRRREIAVRGALGAGRGRIVRQILTESLVLGVTGGAVGLVLGLWTVDALLALAPVSIARAGEVGLDARVLAFAAGVSLVTGVLFGLAGALPASRTHPAGVLRGDARSGGGPGRRRGRNLLIATETALAVVLLAGAGLLIASFMQLRGVEKGFDTENVITVSWPRLPSGYETGERLARFESQVLERIRARPDVTAAAFASNLPLGDTRNFPMTVEGRPEATKPDAEWRGVSPGYFEALRIPVERGRTFAATDDTGPPVVIINQTLAREYFGAEEPIGQRILLGAFRGRNVIPDFHDPPREIVGVVGDIREMGLDQPAKATMYVPQAQTPSHLVSPPELMIRTERSTAVVAAVRRIAEDIEPRMAAPEFRMLTEVVGDSIGRERFNALLMTLFAGLALVLTAIGIYGVVAYSVRQRTQEIGVRMALGAGAGRVSAMVLRESLVVVGVGAAVGLVAALAGTRLLRSLLFGVDPTDPVTLAAGTTVLLGAAALASLIPARRAARIEPSRALRNE